MRTLPLYSLNYDMRDGVWSGPNYFSKINKVCASSLQDLAYSKKMTFSKINNNNYTRTKWSIQSNQLCLQLHKKWCQFNTR